MITPINSLHPSIVHETEPLVPPTPEPPRQTPKSGALSQDQVTLKSAGDVDHDGDAK